MASTHANKIYALFLIIPHSWENRLPEITSFLAGQQRLPGTCWCPWSSTNARLPHDGLPPPGTKSSAVGLAPIMPSMSIYVGFFKNKYSVYLKIQWMIMVDQWLIITFPIKLYICLGYTWVYYTPCLEILYAYTSNMRCRSWRSMVWLCNWTEMSTIYYHHDQLNPINDTRRGYDRP